jgi:hypothetical protein
LPKLDIREYEKLIESIEEDVSKHPKIIEAAMHKHFMDIYRRHKFWYIAEDKISFSKNFTKLFV